MSLVSLQEQADGILPTCIQPPVRIKLIQARRDPDPGWSSLDEFVLLATFIIRFRQSLRSRNGEACLVIERRRACPGRSENVSRSLRTLDEPYGPAQLRRALYL